MGVIHRDKLEDHVTAVRAFDRALDSDPSMLKAIQAIDEVITTSRDYARQDRYYRKNLNRLLENDGDPRVILMLAKNLAQLNHTKLNNPNDAFVFGGEAIFRGRPRGKRASLRPLQRNQELRSSSENSLPLSQRKPTQGKTLPGFTDNAKSLVSKILPAESLEPWSLLGSRKRRPQRHSAFTYTRS